MINTLDANRTAPANLVGRDDDCRRVRALLDDSETGGALVLVGEAGMGKTALLTEIAGALAADGARVCRASGVQFESDVGYSALNQLLFGLSDAFEHLDEAHRTALRTALGFAAGPAPSRILVSNAVLLLVRAAAGKLILIVDDLPWVDSASAGVLGFVSRRLGGSAVRFLGSARSGTTGFFEVGTLPQYRLRPLPETAAHDLLSDRFPMLAPTVRRRVIAEAAGNALALLELPDALTAAQRRAAAQLPAILPLTDRLESLYADRVRNLPEECRRMLLLGALDRNGGRDAIRAAGPDYLEMLAPAERDRLVSVGVDGREFTFRHPLARAAVVSVSTAADKRRAHEAMAAALIAQPERRAWHLGEAATGPDERVAMLLERSAEHAHTCGDSVGAIASLARAAELSPRPADHARRLALAAYLGADAAGEIYTAEQFVERAHRDGSAPLLAVVASAMLLINGGGDVRTAHGLMAAAIEAADHRRDGGDKTLAEALLTLLLISWYAGDEQAWKRYFAAFARLRGRADPCLNITTEIFPDPARVDPAAAARLWSMLAALHEETDPTYVARVGGLAFVLDWAGTARDELWRVVRQGRAGTAPMRRHITGLTGLGFELFHTGQWDALADIAHEGSTLCADHGFTFVQWYFRYHRALLAAARGDRDADPSEADELVRWASARRARGVELYGRQARALHHIGRRDHAAAYRDATAISPAGTFPRFVPQALWVAFDLVESAVHTGRPREARAHVAAMRDLPAFQLSSRLALLGAGAAGLVADDMDVRPAFEIALRSPEADRWPFDHARVRLAYGERLRRLRATQEARAQLSAAADIFRELGASRWLERADSEMRATGLTRPRDASTRWAALTPKEREIAELAASGMSNKEIGERLFLSHRTVGSHLYQIFPKLGLTSRAGLRDALTDLGRRTYHHMS